MSSRCNLQGPFITSNIPAGEIKLMATKGSCQNMVLTTNLNTLYTSSDYGTTWNQKATPFNSNPVFLACSSNRQYIFSAESNGKSVFVSNNFGDSFNSITLSLGSISCGDCNDSGQYVLVTGQQAPLYISTNFGASFTTVSTFGTNRPWFVVSVNSSGQYMFVQIEQDNSGYLSTNYGSTWSNLNFGTFRAISAMISNSGQYIFVTNNFLTMLSINYGASFNSVVLPFSDVPLAYPYKGIAMDASEKFIIVFLRSNYSFAISTDYGLTWTVLSSYIKNFSNLLLYLEYLFQIQDYLFYIMDFNIVRLLFLQFVLYLLNQL